MKGGEGGAAALATLGYALLRPGDGAGDRPGELRLEGPAPTWLREIVPDLDEAAPLPLEEVMPFLANFLVDAQDFWESETGDRLDSGPWIERAGDGSERVLEATALRAGGHPWMVIRRLGADYRDLHAVYQKARDSVLEGEELERLVRERTETIRRREEEIALRLVAAAGSRHQETGEHVRRIGLLAEAVAAELGWSADAREELRLAAAMHDVGKIAVPDAVLLKPGPHSAAEREVMRAHTTLGADLLADSEVALLSLAADIARCHHERWDGSGYPAGLAGEAIPLAARIVAVVDSFDAIVSDRVYREGAGVEEGFRRIEAGRGTLYDPRVVDAFLSLRGSIREVLDRAAREARAAAGDGRGPGGPA